jgi:hypothetical protein
MAIAAGNGDAAIHVAVEPVGDVVDASTVAPVGGVNAAAFGVATVAVATTGVL